MYFGYHSRPGLPPVRSWCVSVMFEEADWLGTSESFRQCNVTWNSVTTREIMIQTLSWHGLLESETEKFNNTNKRIKKGYTNIMTWIILHIYLQMIHVHYIHVLIFPLMTYSWWIERSCTVYQTASSWHHHETNLQQQNILNESSRCII